MELYEGLEQKFGKWAGEIDGNGPLDVVACSSGGAALYLALAALRLPRGTQVVVPDFTMIACARAITLNGLEPVFVDCLNDLTMDPDGLRHKLRDPDHRIQAVMPVHVYGRLCDMEQILAIAARNRLYVVEDCAEYHGGPRPHAREVDAACWSFYQNKIVAGEEGGAVTFRDPEKAELARSLRSYGQTARNNYIHEPGGWNLRLSNANARLVLDSLSRVEENLTRRRQIDGWYTARFPRAWLMPPRQVPWVYDLMLPEDADATRIVQGLNDRDIAARLGFKPLSLQPEHGGWAKSPVALEMSRRVIYLPLDPRLTEPEVDRTCRLLMDLALNTLPP